MILGLDEPDKASIAGFWNWFVLESDAIRREVLDIRSGGSPSELLKDDLGRQLKQVYPRLECELLMKGDIIVLVISPCGNQAGVPTALALIEAAPSLPSFEFLAFRPRGRFSDMTIGGQRVSEDMVSYLLLQDSDDGLIVYVFIDAPLGGAALRAAGLRFLEQALGEFDLMTEIGGMGFEREAPEDARPISELRADFDTLLGRPEAATARAEEPVAAPRSEEPSERAVAAFWRWFLFRWETLLREFQRAREVGPRTHLVHEELADALRKVHPSLVHEMGPLPDGRMEFVVSADGIRAAFPAVLRLIEAAPRMPAFHFTAFRPRHEIYGLEWGGRRLVPELLRYRLHGERGDLSLELFVDADLSERQLEHMGFLMLDQALGEFDVATEIGAIGFNRGAPEDARPFLELPVDFDARLGRTAH